MSNISVDLPVPAGTGAGAWVDTSGLSPEKTIIVDNGPFTGQLFVEMSNDGSSAVAPENIPIFANNQVYPFTATLQFMRVRRLGSGGSPTVSVAAAPATGNLFATLNVVVGGTGTSTDLSLGGDINTFEVSGAFSGYVFVELSDDGTTFSSSLLFTAAGSRTFLGPLRAVRVRTAQIAGATPAVSVGSGSATAGGSGQAILNFESIAVLGTSMLSTFDPTGYTPGATIAYVGNTTEAQESVGDYFRLALDENVATPDGITVVQSPIEGLIWLRMLIPNQQSLAAPFWAVDDAADPENTGWGLTQDLADLHPIPSAELRRRLTGSAYDTTVVIHQLANANTATWATLDTVKTKNGSGFPIWLGTKTVIAGPITLTAVQVAVPGTNTARSITGAALGAAGNVGFMVQRSDGGKTAFSTRSAGATVLEIGEVRTSNAATGDPGVVTDFIVGEVVNVYQLTTTPAHPFSGDLMFCGVGQVEIKRPVAPQFDQGNMGASWPFYTNVSFDGAVMGGGASVVVANALFRTRRTSLQGGNYQMESVSAITAGEGLELDGNCHVTVTDEMLIQNSRLVLGGSSEFDHSGGTGDLGLFNCAAVAVLGVDGSSFRKRTGNTYGLGNTNFLFQFTGGIWEINGLQATAVSTAPVVQVFGRGYSFAQLPVVDVGSGSFVADPAATTRRISSVNFTGQITTDNGATRTSYLANPGTANLAAGNQTLAQEYATSKRQFEVLRAVKLLTGPGVAVTLTVYKSTGGGALGATTMTLTIPAADAVRTRYEIINVTVQFADGDTYALRMDSAIDAAPGTLAISATLE